MIVAKENSGKFVQKVRINKKDVTIIFRDGERIKISPESYTSSFIYPGKLLTTSEIDLLKLITDTQKLSNYVMNLLSKRHYTEWKMREKLYAKGAEKEQVDFIITKLKELDLLDDRAFVEDYLGYAEERLIGKNKIKQELLKKGIFAEKIEKIHFPINVEKKKAIKLIPMLERRYEDRSYEQKRRCIYNALISRGFDSDIAKYALNSISSKDEKKEKKKIKEDYKKLLARYSRKYKGRELREKMFRALVSRGYSYDDVSEVLGGLD